MIRLVEPSTALRASWRESLQEWGEDYHSGHNLHGFTVAEVMTDAGFDRWLTAQLRNRTEPPQGWVPSSLFWVVDDAEPEWVLGSLSLRHELNDHLFEEGGHIGYGVRPSGRGRGVATAALRESLPVARGLGVERALVTCDDDNLASACVIERCGGVLEDVRGVKRRYWIDLR